MPGWTKRSARRVVLLTFLTAAFLTLSFFAPILACNFAGIWLMVAIALFRENARALFWIPLAAWGNWWLLSVLIQMFELPIPSGPRRGIFLLPISQGRESATLVAWLISVTAYVIVKTVKHHNPISYSNLSNNVIRCRK